jgi:hypothetical protein
MDYLQMLLQSAVSYFEYLVSLYDSYDFYLPTFSIMDFAISFDAMLLLSVLALLVLFFIILWIHPIYFLSRHNGLQKVGWRKVNNYFHLSKTAKVLAENDHYGFSPKMDIIIHQNRHNIFTTMEIFCLGMRRFAIYIPEKKWVISNDALIATLLRPKMTLRKRYFLFPTLIFMFSKTVKSSQRKTFSWIQKKIQNKNLKNFLLISLYIFFLPLLYTRLNLRYYSYHKLMEKIYGAELATDLSKELSLELEEFHHKPISYFFGQIHEAV